MRLARLQQAITVGSVMLAATWAALCWRSGHPLWGAAGAAVIVSGYAFVLAIEFLLLRSVHAHAHDPAPRASASQLLGAWWGEVRAAPQVFCWRQPFCSRRWPDQLPTDAHGRRGVLLIHGFVCNRGLWNHWLERLTRDGVPFVAVSLQPVFGTIDDYLPCIDDAVRRLHACTGLPPLVVAHSMGGLVLRRWWAAQHGEQGVQHDTMPRVQHVLTIGTPHQGTWLARFGSTHNARQMQQGSRWLRALQGVEPADRPEHFTCFYSHCDNIVFPPSLATLPGADNRHLPGLAHVQMADASAPWKELQRLLHAPHARAGAELSRPAGSPAP